MTLKKQFTLLASIIITIPILCIAFIFIYNYLKSSDRLLIKEYTELKKNQSSLYNKEDWKTIYSSINNLPPDVEAALVSENSTVIISTIPEIPVDTEISFGFLWQIQNIPHKKNYYQFSIIDISTSKMLLVTRVSKNKQAKTTKIGIFPSLLFFLFIIVLICFIFLLLIFKNINKSISTLEQETQEIAAGDLSVKINTSYKESYSNEITSISLSLEKMRQSLLEAQNQQTKFIMGISHDLRTPVAIIKGYTEALSDGIISEPEEISNTYSLIGNKTAQLDNMINSLINFMKMNYADFRETLSNESITKLINEFFQDAKVSGNVFNRKVCCNNELSEDILVPMNKTLISRAFENLLSNALRYTKENDTITISAYKINDSEIKVAIADTGIGIEEKDLNQIFDLFYRGTNSRREEGMGIGLSVVKNIMETHNWNIEVKSEKDKGTCFIITIPLKN